jgi:hypothetical protein
MPTFLHCKLNWTVLKMLMWKNTFLIGTSTSTKHLEEVRIRKFWPGPVKRSKYRSSKQDKFLWTNGVQWTALVLINCALIDHSVYFLTSRIAFNTNLNCKYALALCWYRYFRVIKNMFSFTQTLLLKLPVNLLATQSSQFNANMVMGSWNGVKKTQK